MADEQATVDAQLAFRTEGQFDACLGVGRIRGLGLLGDVCLDGITFGQVPRPRKSA